MKRLSGTTTTMLAAVAIAVIAAAPFVGMKFIALSEISLDQTVREIFWSLRVPRVLTAFLAGGGLALCGMVFQAVFRNPLATPFTLGVSSGASCGAAVAILFGLNRLAPAMPVVPLGAFVGAMAAMGLVYAFTTLSRDFSTLTLLLAGIAVSFIFSSSLMFLQYLSNFTHSFQIVRWLMGGIEVFGYGHFATMVPLVLAGGMIIAFFLPHLDHLLSGEDLAHSRGVNVGATRTWLFIAASVMVAGIVAVCGPVGFVGMMTPHICRLALGGRHTTLGPACFLFGGAFLVLCDTVARTIVAPAEMPVGVLTALMGGPFFLWLLFGREKQVM
ncbi:MAG: iron chelate uptake ABC transporter family permease subunit [Chitinivibrionales bacterium]|nr:iron chelate uptake ABC transporter family permease subunit [Chitinivibrionales bacterium]MBD3358906.1 iron chelate uptake ABC transporter family permease subunit [Chitinivibrionales bacterium]